MFCVLTQHACQSEGNALYFHGGEGVGHNFATTRDIDLHREEGRSYWEEDFESPPSKWVKLRDKLLLSETFWYIWFLKN